MFEDVKNANKTSIYRPRPEEECRTDLAKQVMWRSNRDGILSEPGASITCCFGNRSQVLNIRNPAFGAKELIAGNQQAQHVLNNDEPWSSPLEPWRAKWP